MEIDKLSDIVQLIKKAIQDEYIELVVNALTKKWEVNIPVVKSLGYQIIEKWLESSDEKFFIFGIGKHTDNLFREEKLNKYESRLIGFIDECYESKTSYKGWTVFPLEIIRSFPHSYVILSSDAHENNMLASIKSFVVDKKKILSVYSSKEYQELYFEANPEAKISSYPSKKFKLAIITFDFRHSISIRTWDSLFFNDVVILDMSASISGNGLSVFKTLSESQKKDYYYCQQSYKLLIQLLEVVAPDFVYIYDTHSTKMFTGTLLKAIYPDMKVMVEAYDLLYISYDDPNVLVEHDYWTKNDMQLALASETEFLNNVDGFVIKDNIKVFKSIYGNYISKPLMSFPPLLQSSQMYFNEKNVINKNYNLVYTGTVIENNISDPIFGESNYLKTFSMICEQSLHLSIYTGDSDYISFKRDNPNYANLIENNYNFVFKCGLSRNNLIYDMSRKFDFGICIQYWEAEFSGKIFRKLARTASFGSKILTYLAAGLPVIVTDNQEYVAKLVTNWKVGIVINAKDLPNLEEIIDNCDYSYLKQNVRNLQKQIAIENHVGQISSFIDAVVQEKTNYTQSIF